MFATKYRLCVCFCNGGGPPNIHAGQVSDMFLYIVYHLPRNVGWFRETLW